MSLEKCSLCTNMEDPRFGAQTAGRHFPLCDGCGGPENQEQARLLFDRLAALPLPPPVRCENFAGGAQCPGDATHTVRIDLDDGTYESELCGQCFDGFRDEMRKRGMPPRNDASEHKGTDHG